MFKLTETTTLADLLSINKAFSAEIEERKRVEQELRASEEQFRALVENVPGAVYRCEICAPWRVHHMSDGAELLTGYPARAFIEGKLHWADLVVPEDLLHVEDAVAEGVKNRRYYEIEYRIKDANDAILWVHEKGRAIYDDMDQANFLDGVIINITAAKRAEDAVSQLNAELEQRVETRTAQLQSIIEELEAFSYSIAHDLRTPLRSITSFSQIIQEDAANRLRRNEKESLERVIRAGQHMAQLIDEILELARITRIELTQNPVDLSALVYDAVKNVHRAHPERNVEWFVQDGVTVYGDAHLLFLLLQNLIDNACKFSRDREVSKIEFVSQREGSETACYIRDNGIGFDMRYAKNLFKPFNRFHKEKDFPGTGIGLATVARIAKRHGGKVWAESAPDEGATFYFTLPGAR
jgi:hypothetical protein